MWDQPWGWCPAGVSLRDSPAFRTIVLPVLPVLLKNLGGTRIVQGFVEIGTVFEVPGGSFGFSVKPGRFFHWPFLSQPVFLSLTLQAKLKKKKMAEHCN